MPTYPITGSSSGFVQAKNKAEKLAQTDVPVCLLGESGVGKEAFARFIHTRSTQEGQFIPLNCGALSEDLIRSKLFGYEKGAFTGAVQQTKGVFELGNAGTVFLDEVGELSFDLQVQILRIVEYQCLRRLGGQDEIALSFRLICASDASLKDMVEKRELREDLYWCIAANPLLIPPLRERNGDILLLAKQFCEEGGVEIPGSDVLRCLLDYAWPGNVRELRGFVDRIVAISSRDRLIRKELFEEELQRHRISAPTSARGPGADIHNDLAEQYAPYLERLGLRDSATSGAIVQLAIFLDQLSRSQRRRFLGKRCSITQDAICVEILADAISLWSVIAADRLEKAPMQVACDDFDLKRIGQNSSTDLVAVERAVYERLKNEYAPSTAADDVVAERMAADARTGRLRMLSNWVAEAKETEGKFDVFLSYNSKDGPEVRRIAEELKKVRLRPWVDYDCLVPGRRWIPELEEVIGDIPCAAVFIGPEGRGPWEEVEVEGMLIQMIERDAAVMPVLLPGAPEDVRLPPFLKTLTRVNMREWRTGDSEGLERLVSGILGRPLGELRMLGR